MNKYIIKAFETAAVTVGTAAAGAIIKAAKDPATKEKAKEFGETAKVLGSVAVDKIKNRFKKNDGPQ